MLAALIVQVLSQDLDQLVAEPSLKSAEVGICVLDEDGKELYAHNADIRLIPASNQKLVSAAYALATLGPTYKPVTRFWKDGDTITVDSTGDPLLTYDDLSKIASGLGRADRVKVHEAYKPTYPTGWEWDDLPNKYAAPVSAFTVDRGSFELWTEKGKLFFLPTNYGAKAKYQPGKDEGASDEFNPVTMRAVVTGKLPKERALLDTLALGQPDFAAASILGRHASYTDAVPTSAPTLTHEGSSLGETLKADLPSSDNNIAENLLLMASGVTVDDADPYATAEEKLKNFLTTDVGLNEDDFHVADGSGLSRHNVITPRSLAKLLVWADHQPTKALWHDCLAHPGEEGTLHNRLDRVPFEGKTGTMEMVSALSGYVHLKNGRTLTVAIMVNDYACSTAETRDFQDRVIKKVLDDGNGGTLFAESDK